MNVLYEAYFDYIGSKLLLNANTLAYADNVDIIGRSDREIAVAFSKFAEEARSIVERRYAHIVAHIAGLIIWCRDLDTHLSQLQMRKH